MKRIILFRFHRYPFICNNRLRLLQKFNPNIRIFGLYGGAEKNYQRFKEKLNPCVKDLYCIRGKTERWKRLNADLAVRLWYKDIGKTVDFDMLHLIEWDLMLFDSLDKIYSEIPQEAIGLTALTLLKNVEKDWWISKEPYQSQWRQLLDFVRENFNYNQQPYACQGPGPCIPKGFLERYSEAEIPELCNDELRLPLFSQVFGFRLYDTGLCKKWFDKEEAKFFNCAKIEIKLSVINRQVNNPSGRRAFHPFSKLIIFNPMDSVINLWLKIKELIRPFFIIFVPLSKLQLANLYHFLPQAYAKDAILREE